MPDFPIASIDLTGLTSTSARIRHLKDLGYRQADIARHLGIRDQHVSNVVRGPRPKADGPARVEGVSEAERPFQNVSPPRPVRLTVGIDGAVRLPGQWGVRPGTAFIARKFGGSLVLMDVAEASEAACLDEGADDAVDDLIAERRLEAMREFDD